MNCVFGTSGTNDPQPVILRWPGQDRSPGEGVAALLAAYHLRTEAEKGNPVATVDDLPDRYRAEITDPRSAFARETVLVAVLDDSAVGCLVVTAPAGGYSELKRLWTHPAFRGRGIASSLLHAALAEAANSGVDTVRLSVWEWRTAAVALYERLGFTPTEPWDEREQLLCMQRTASICDHVITAVSDPTQPT